MAKKSALKSKAAAPSLDGSAFLAALGPKPNAALLGLCDADAPHGTTDMLLAAGIAAAVGAGADPNVATRGNTPLSLVAKKLREHSMRALLDAGADPNGGDGGSFSPYAAASEHASPGRQHESAAARCLAMLVEAGADPNRALPSGALPLNVAVAHGQGELAEALLRAGADANAECPKLGHPLRALVAGHIWDSSVAQGLFHALLAAGADIERVEAPASELAGKPAGKKGLKGGAYLLRVLRSNRWAQPCPDLAGWLVAKMASNEEAEKLARVAGPGRSGPKPARRM